MNDKKCARCKAGLSVSNPGFICLPCQRKLIDDWARASEVRYLDVEDMRVLLGLDSEEQVRRLARQGKLPPRIPAIKKWLWEEEVVRDWMRSGYEVTQIVKNQLAAMGQALGGAHIDEDTGEIRYGDKVDIQVQVYSNIGTKKDPKVLREVKRKSFVTPRYPQ